MEEKLKFVQLMFDDLLKSVKVYIKCGGSGYGTENYMNKNHGKTPLKRKITYLRQELLNLERMVDEL